MASKNRHSKKVESTDLAVLVAGEIASALTYKESELDPSREQALNYSRGHMPDLVTLPNRSRLTSRDVADVIVQDEFTHDVVMTGPDALYLCFDTT